MKPTVACYHWSNWHPTENNDIERGKGWTEWEYLKRAIPRFPGHKQPKVPMWGYLDDSKPENVERQINTAADYGIDAFIFDWGRPDGNNNVIEQFIKSDNKRLKFSLMCCGGARDEEDFYRDMAYVFDNYFVQPNYWKVNGGYYLSFYEIGRYINYWGGLDKTKAIFDNMHKMAAERNMKIHLVAVEWGLQEYWCKDIDPRVIVKELGFDAITSYVWAHNTVPEWPCGDYSEWAENAYEKMREIEQKYPVPYYTHVSMGWDPSPRCPEDMYYEEGGPLMYHTLSGEYKIMHKPYFSAIVKNNTPEEFRRALLAAKRHLQDTNPENPIVTLYAWNEWTEGGYLEPDSEYGYGYLEAIKSVFK